MNLNQLYPKEAAYAGEEFPKIDPLPEGLHRPFWSVMIPTYNRKKLLEETLRSLLEQAPESSEMQIEVIDNCSPEVDTEAIVKEIGGGRVSFYRQPYNVGMTGNWNACINRARGHWVHILHDDDTVLPGFYKHLQESLEKEPDLGAALSRYICMDEEGHWQYLSPLEMRTSGILQNWLERISPGVIQCSAVVVKRSTYEQLGGFCLELKYMVDMEMWMRIALHYPFWYEPQPLVCYRSQTAISGTSAIFQSTILIADGYRFMSVLKSYFPEAIASQLLNKIKKEIEIFLIIIIRKNINDGNTKTAINQMQELLKYDRSLRTIKGIVRSLLLLGEYWFFQAGKR